MAAPCILITGPPGIGKTTVIKSAASQLKALNPVGFYTAEIREQGIRQGFELVSLDGRRAILARVDLDSPFRVGRYGVDVPAFEAFLHRLKFSDPRCRLAVIDEIGKMELYSFRFRRLVDDLLNDGNPFLATVALKGGGYIQEVKKRQGVRLYEVNTANRTALVSEIVRKIEGF